MAEITYISEQGSQLAVHYDDGSVKFAAPATGGFWTMTPGKDDPDPPNPEPSDWIHPLKEALPWSTYADGNGSHSGGAVDIPAAQGRTLYACTDGKVIYSGWEAGGGGNVFILQPTGKPEGIVYAHMANPPTVAVGATVKVGQPVGVVGMTGTASGPHLHLEVRQNGTQWGPWYRAVPYFTSKGVDMGRQIG